MLSVYAYYAYRMIFMTSVGMCEDEKLRREIFMIT